jgi:hypothetical protein
MIRTIVNSVRFWQGTTVAVLGLFIFSNFFQVNLSPRSTSQKTAALESNNKSQTSEAKGRTTVNYASYVIPEQGVELPVTWGNLGKQLVESGIINQTAFESLYNNNRGGMSAYEQNLLLGETNGNLKIDQQNANFLLNMLWAFGLGNSNAVLDNGPMQNTEYGGAGGFASTGGWSLAKGSAMEHYSKHAFTTLTDEEQKLVERVSKGIYRPCCGNSTYFPDCNHGMAMLGLLELGASQGLSEHELYDMALKANSYWFPQTYLTIAKFLDMQGLGWGDVSPKEILGNNFSSSGGYRNILAQVEPVGQQGGGCGV